MPTAAETVLEMIPGWDNLTEAQREPKSRWQSPHASTSVEPQSFAVQALQHKHDTDDDGHRYQTMCVRSCDGYYWPLRYPAYRRDFARDEASCQAACGSETKLYFRSTPAVEAEEMTDLDGKSYGASSKAFVYRKGLINGCTCRPMPWSDGERARHEGYALARQEQTLRMAQAEADRAAVLVEIAVDNARPVSGDMGGAVRGIELASQSESGPPIGPAEASVLAQRRQALQTDGPALIDGRRVRENVTDRPAKSVRGLQATDEVKPRPQRREGDQRSASKVQGSGKSTAIAQSSTKTATFAWLANGLGGPVKFTYPGDPPGRSR